jgi:hypothetical protein
MHNWKNLPLKRSETAAPPRGRIHPRMIERLTDSGDDGVAWKDFSDLAWRSEFHSGRIHMAMREIARHYGYAIQFAGSRTVNQSPDRYRIVPGWKHVSGQRTSPADFT